MGEVVTKIFILMGKIAFYAISIFALTVILTIVLSAIMVGLNFGVINDIVAIIQMWLPFNLGVIIAWLLTVSLAYLAYRLSVIAINYVDAFFN